MSLLSDVRFFLRKYLKNPVVVAALSYVVYRLLNKHLKKESFAERVDVIKKKGTTELIYDTELQKYIIIKNNGEEVYSSTDKNTAIQFLEESP